MGKDRSQFSYGLPGGRAYYRGKDAYAAQSRENESRIEQQPGYVKAVLQSDYTLNTGLNTILWTTTTLSNFVPALSKFGWGYTESTGAFTCMRSGLYQVNLQFRVYDCVAAEIFTAELAVSRTLPGLSAPYTYTLQELQTAPGTRCVVGLTTDFQFQASDQVSVVFNNGGAGTRHINGLIGAGTSAETQTSGYFNLWQID